MPQRQRCQPPTQERGTARSTRRKRRPSNQFLRLPCPYLLAASPLPFSTLDHSAPPSTNAGFNQSDQIRHTHTGKQTRSHQRRTKKTKVSFFSLAFPTRHSPSKISRSGAHHCPHPKQRVTPERCRIAVLLKNSYPYHQHRKLRTKPTTPTHIRSTGFALTQIKEGGGTCQVPITDSHWSATPPLPLPLPKVFQPSLNSNSSRA